MKILYIDPIFGISGDMTISAFIDAGLPFQEISALLEKVPLEFPAISPVRIQQGVIEGIHLNIEESDQHFTVSEMKSILNGLNVSERIKKDAMGMLELILHAESKIHGIGLDDLHLHELSHIDTLMDLLCVAKGMDYFGIGAVYCGPVPCGRGTIKTAHGIIPNPPPVTLEILDGFPLAMYDEPLELTTPTGAAIVRYFVGKKKTAPPFTPERIGYGMGTYSSARPDALRIFIGTSETLAIDEDVFIIECDLDDTDPEYIGVIADRIREDGALDVLYFPVYMKKGRPGIRISVTVAPDKAEDVMRMIFRETTTFGVRLRKDSRRILRRNERICETSFGPVRVKDGFDMSGAFLKSHIEFEDVRRIADEKGLPYRDVLQAIQSKIDTRK